MLNLITYPSYPLLYYILPILSLIPISEISVSKIRAEVDDGTSSVSIKGKSEILYAMTENDLNLHELFYDHL